MKLPTMASSSLSLLLLLLFILTFFFSLSLQQPRLSSDEQEAVYTALESINSAIPWRTLFPDDLCLSAPHGVVCDYFPSNGNATDPATSLIPHIVELNFGFVSDYTPNPPCFPNSTFPHFPSSLSHLRKLFFYRCFTQNPVPLPDFSDFNFVSDMEELVFLDNPELFGSLNASIGKFKSLRRLILSGSKVSGNIPNEVTNLSNLEQLTLSGNKLNRGLPWNFGGLKKLKLLDLSNNLVEGPVPESLGQLSMLLKLDLSSNKLIGEIPESLKDLQSLQFMDLSFNSFNNSGIPLFLGEMPRLKELYLSGNQLGGAIPEIWDTLGGILGIGFSGLGLVGKIPPSMGLFLRNAVYIGLDNNKLEGTVPKEFGGLDNLQEVNLQNNQLSGVVPFSAAFAAAIGSKVKLEGNPGLCIDRNLRSAKTVVAASSLRNLRVCNETEVPNPALFSDASSLHLDSYLTILFLGFWSFPIVVALLS
ncbi:hypothetical protein Ancab_019707 [Ancistrocladus abbreviatus]